MTESTKTETTGRDPRGIACTYYIESLLDPRKAAEILAGEQSSGTFIALPGETDRIRYRHAAQVTEVRRLGNKRPSLPSRILADTVQAAEVDIEYPMENVSTDITTLLTTIAGNLFELAPLFACRLQTMTLPQQFVDAQSGPGFGITGTRALMKQPSGVLVGTIVKPNVGLNQDEYRDNVRALIHADLDLIKDDELMTNPVYLPLADRVRIATEEIRKAEDDLGRRVMYAFNITGNITGLRQRHDLVVAAGGTCVMMNIPIMGLSALEYLRSFAEVPIHGHRVGFAASSRHPGLGVNFTVWQQLARLAGADHLHASGLGGKFYETDADITVNVNSLRYQLGDTLLPMPTLSSGQTVHTAKLTYDAIHSEDLLILAGGGIAAHPDGAQAGVRSIRQAWEAATTGKDLGELAATLSADGDTDLARSIAHFPKGD